LKIAPLLAQYLYHHKRLDLPGLGSFLLDPSASVEPEINKQNKATNLEGVSFENNPSLRETSDLVQFISSHTGKIKALAAADLESHLGLAQQFLNIGKPFLFEGIGSLVKIRSGEYSFSSGQAIYVPPIKEQTSKGSVSTPTEESVHDYKSVFYPGKKKMQWKKPIAALLLLAGLGLAVWGGYTVYKRTTEKKQDVADADDKKNETVLVNPDTLVNQSAVTPTLQTNKVPDGNFKYILETAHAQRAFSRFSRLKTFQWNVQMETRDSLSYTLFMLLPGQATDTTRLLDSLTRLNGKRVYIDSGNP
jgi:hypothetical protein